MNKSVSSSAFMLGVCYYPEHWHESLWQDDFRRMKEMGFSVIRIAEFAWALFEPEEGKFEFDLFNRALDCAHQHGLNVIMGTPTATPPAWLTHKYPEVLNALQNGDLFTHGHRRHTNYTSPKYLELCSRITTEMVRHYKDHPAIIGWQIDNELNCEIDVFYSEADQIAFRAWTEEKYSTLKMLNQAWGTIFWSQTYTSWDQVRLSGPTPNEAPNPHQVLDEKRFISDSAFRFAAVQESIIRSIAPHHWVTTNGIFNHIDYQKMTQKLLDFISYDTYPSFGFIFPDPGEDALLDRKWSQSLSEVRDISPQFCVMEQQSGPGGWVNKINLPSPEPGQMRLWTYQSVAHGADMLLYFRWRTATMGTEIYWHGINDYHNGPNRRIEEAMRISGELSSIGDKIVGSTYRAEVAILKDYDNEWDGEFDNWHGPMTARSTREWFKALQYNHIPADMKDIRDSTEIAELSRYKVLIYPHAAIMTESRAELLQRFVQDGGTLILGARTGFKDIHGQCPMRPFPGLLAELCGVTIEDFTLITGTVPPANVTFEGPCGVTVVGELSNDILAVNAEDVEVVARYSSKYYKGKPALTRRSVGHGEVLYYGAAFTRAAAEAIMDRIGLKSPLAHLCELPEKVECAIREKNGVQLLFLLNYNQDIVTLTFHQPAMDLLNQWMIQGSIELEGYGVLALEILH